MKDNVAETADKAPDQAMDAASSAKKSPATQTSSATAPVKTAPAQSTGAVSVAIESPSTQTSSAAALANTVPAQPAGTVSAVIESPSVNMSSAVTSAKTAAITTMGAVSAMSAESAADDCHVYYMRAALREARKAARLGEVPIGAVIVHEGRIIGRGGNRRETRQDVTLHAELVAIRQACRRLGSWRLTDCRLYVTLEPCIMCAGAIVQARIGGLYYGTSDPKAGAAGSIVDIFAIRQNHWVQVQGGLLADSCRAILQDFFRERRQVDKTTGSRAVRRQAAIAAIAGNNAKHRRHRPGDGAHDLAQELSSRPGENDAPGRGTQDQAFGSRTGKKVAPDRGSQEPPDAPIG